MSCIHYKFKNSLDYETLPFDGLHISVGDLKRAIYERSRIGKSNDSDLQITNAQTKETYESESTLISRNTSVIVARVPASTQQKLPKVWNTSTEGIVKKGKDLQKENPVFMGGSEAADLAGDETLTEEEKLAKVMQSSTAAYQPSQYKRRTIMSGPPPPSYICNQCGQGGHWITQCINPKLIRGVPRQELEKASSDHPFAYQTGKGDFVVNKVHEAARKNPKKERPPFLPDSDSPERAVGSPVPMPEISRDLICELCDQLLNDAVLISCCGTSFCDECIRQRLLTGESSLDHLMQRQRPIGEHNEVAMVCPHCYTENMSPDNLVPNNSLRNMVNDFKRQLDAAKRGVVLNDPTREAVQRLDNKRSPSPELVVVKRKDMVQLLPKPDQSEKPDASPAGGRTPSDSQAGGGTPGAADSQPVAGAAPPPLGSQPPVMAVMPMQMQFPPPPILPRPPMVAAVPPIVHYGAPVAPMTYAASAVPPTMLPFPVPSGAPPAVEGATPAGPQGQPLPPGVSQQQQGAAAYHPTMGQSQSTPNLHHLQPPGMEVAAVAVPQGVSPAKEPPLTEKQFYNKQKQLWEKEDRRSFDALAEYEKFEQTRKKAPPGQGRQRSPSSSSRSTSYSSESASSYSRSSYSRSYSRSRSRSRSPRRDSDRRRRGPRRRSRSQRSRSPRRRHRPRRSRSSTYSPAPRARRAAWSPSADRPARALPIDFLYHMQQPQQQQPHTPPVYQQQPPPMMMPGMPPPPMMGMPPGPFPGAPPMGFPHLPPHPGQSMPPHHQFAPQFPQQGDPRFGGGYRGGAPGGGQFGSARPPFRAVGGGGGSFRPRFQGSGFSRGGSQFAGGRGPGRDDFAPRKGPRTPSTPRSRSPSSGDDRLAMDVTKLMRERSRKEEKPRKRSAKPSEESAKVRKEKKDKENKDKVRTKSTSKKAKTEKASPTKQPVSDVKSEQDTTSALGSKPTEPPEAPVEGPKAEPGPGQTSLVPTPGSAEKKHRTSSSSKKPSHEKSSAEKKSHHKPSKESESSRKTSEKSSSRRDSSSKSTPKKPPTKHVVNQLEGLTTVPMDSELINPSMRSSYHHRSAGQINFRPIRERTLSPARGSTDSLPTAKKTSASETSSVPLTSSQTTISGHTGLSVSLSAPNSADKEGSTATATFAKTSSESVVVSSGIKASEAGIGGPTLGDKTPEEALNLPDIVTAAVAAPTGVLAPTSQDIPSFSQEATIVTKPVSAAPVGGKHKKKPPGADDSAEKPRRRHSHRSDKEKKAKKLAKEKERKEKDEHREEKSSQKFSDEPSVTKPGKMAALAAPTAAATISAKKELGPEAAAPKKEISAAGEISASKKRPRSPSAVEEKDEQRQKSKASEQDGREKRSSHHHRSSRHHRSPPPPEVVGKSSLLFFTKPSSKEQQVVPLSSKETKRRRRSSGSEEEEYEEELLPPKKSSLPFAKEMPPPAKSSAKSAEAKEERKMKSESYHREEKATKSMATIDDEKLSKRRSSSKRRRAGPSPDASSSESERERDDRPRVKKAESLRKTGESARSKEMEPKSGKDRKSRWEDTVSEKSGHRLLSPNSKRTAELSASLIQQVSSSRSAHSALERAAERVFYSKVPQPLNQLDFIPDELLPKERKHVAAEKVSSSKPKESREKRVGQEKRDLDDAPRAKVLSIPKDEKSRRIVIESEEDNSKRSRDESTAISVSGLKGARTISAEGNSLSITVAKQRGKPAATEEHSSAIERVKEATITAAEARRLEKQRAAELAKVADDQEDLRARLRRMDEGKPPGTGGLYSDEALGMDRKVIAKEKPLRKVREDEQQEQLLRQASVAKKSSLRSLLDPILPKSTPPGAAGGKQSTASKPAVDPDQFIAWPGSNVKSSSPGGSRPAPKPIKINRDFARRSIALSTDAEEPLSTHNRKISTASGVDSPAKGPTASAVVTEKLAVAAPLEAPPTGAAISGLSPGIKRKLSAGTNEPASSGLAAKRRRSVAVAEELDFGPHEAEPMEKQEIAADDKPAIEADEDSKSARKHSDGKKKSKRHRKGHHKRHHHRRANTEEAKGKSKKAKKSSRHATKEDSGSESSSNSASD